MRCFARSRGWRAVSFHVQAAYRAQLAFVAVLPLAKLGSQPGDALHVAFGAVLALRVVYSVQGRSGAARRILASSCASYASYSRFIMGEVAALRIVPYSHRGIANTENHKCGLSEHNTHCACAAQLAPDPREIEGCEDMLEVYWMQARPNLTHRVVTAAPYWAFIMC